MEGGLSKRTADGFQIEKSATLSSAPTPFAPQRSIQVLVRMRDLHERSSKTILLFGIDVVLASLLRFALHPHLERSIAPPLWGSSLPALPPPRLRSQAELQVPFPTHSHSVR